MNPSEWPRSVAPSRDNPPGYSVGIVIPVKNGLKFFKLCFHSILNFADHPHTITVVDNQSNLKTKDYFRIQAQNHGISVVRYDEDFNYAAEVNRGLRAAFAARSIHFGLVVQADVVVGPEFLSRLVLPFAEEERLGVSAPGGGDPIEAACLIFRRRVFEEVGGFDEDFKGCGYESLDFVERARVAGWQVRENPSVRIHHFGAAFLRGPERADVESANLLRFKEKHPAWSERIDEPRTSTLRRTK